MDTSLSIRRYEPRDREAVWNLHNKALHDVGAHLGDGGEFLVGEMDGSLVVMGALKKTDARRVELPGTRPRGASVAPPRHDGCSPRRLYEKNGYEESGRGRIGPFECVFMEKGL